MWRVLILLLPTTALAESLVATRVIRAQEIIAADAVTLVSAVIPGALADAVMAIGQEARAAIYPGRPVLATNVGPAARVERNQIVSLQYRMGVLTIRTDGRALQRGSAGEVIAALNLSSKTRVTGRVAMDGTIEVGQSATP